MRRGFTLRELIVVTAITFVLAAMVFPGGVGWTFEIPVTLALGWVKYLWKVVPQVNPDPWAVGTAVACLAGVTVGAHFFLRWLAARAWSWNRTFRCVGLIVLMFVAGIAVVGMIHQTSWLARSPEPLFLSRGGTRTYSANNLKQIGIATHSHHDFDQSKALPRSTFSAAGQPIHSWQTALLPYIEQEQLYKQIDLTKSWTHPANANPLATPIKVYLNPSFSDGKVNDSGVSHYAGNAAVVLGDAKTLQSFPAGTSNTILAGEVSSNFRAWGDPLNARDPRTGAGGQPNGFGARGRPAQFVMLDGSVRTIDPAELAELMSKVPE